MIDLIKAVRWVSVASWCMLFLCLVASGIAFILEGPWVLWLIATLGATNLVRTEALNDKMKKFAVVEDDDE